MKSIHRTILFSVICFVVLSSGGIILAYQNPTANAGTDLYLSSGQTATLAGSGSDLDGGILTYYWSCDGGTLTDHSAGQPIYTAPIVVAYNPQAIYTCTLTVTDSTGLSNSDSVKIYVNYGSSANVVNIDVLTNSPTNVNSNQATLNGSYTANNDQVSYVWFQYGQSTNYGDETPHQSMSAVSSAFSQNLTSLFLNATYHYRAVAQDTQGNKFYGQDLIFLTNQNAGINNGALSIAKKVVNLSSGDLTWDTAISASPSDILCFSIILQANSQTVHNVSVRDVLPTKLTYRGGLTVTGSTYTGDISSGLNIGTMAAGQVVTISYQVQTASADSFSLGSTALTNNVTVTSTETGSQTGSATINVNRAVVFGATTIPTGLTNNLLTDSFFLPLLLIITGLWLYFSGKIYVIADALKAKIKR